METTRKIDRIIRGHHTSDGAGVRLTRIFGFHEEGLLDPFLLLDFFGSDNPEEYMAGFPWHPHRGIETVTYIIDGRVEHGDSMGNKGLLGSGDIQWMTAGSGIIHQEMPKPDGKRMFGFQLWVNLPASHKMMKPRYQDIHATSIPVTETPGGIRVKVLAGTFNGINGPVKDIIADPEYFDVDMPAGTTMEIPVTAGHTAFAYLFEGEAFFDESRKEPLHSGEGALFSEGTRVLARTGNSRGRFIFFSGKPLHEPVAWGGPIVMNTHEELELAFREVREGTFVK
jgi:redox-sensitive bicupin YhaK (pirin superfamily)